MFEGGNMNSINFPNLGIFLDNVPQFFSIFGFRIALYGMIIGVGILLGFVIGINEAKRTGQNPDDYWTMGLIGVVAGVLGARIYYVIFTWDQYNYTFFSIFNLRQGGLAIYGGIIAAFATAITYARIKKLNTMLIFDTVALCFIPGQILGRWGNFFNREAFGEYTNSLFAMQIPTDRVSSVNVTPLMEQHTEVINGINFIQVHPTFFYESMWNLALLIGMIFYRKHKKYHGEVFLIYIFGYGVGRFWIETLRSDQLMLFANVPVSLALAGATLLVSGFFLIYLRIRNKKPHKGVTKM
jgi:phosphatidylglycerol:prolipoprotein diacylglycerol transferase